MYNSKVTKYLYFGNDMTKIQLQLGLFTVSVYEHLSFNPCTQRKVSAV